MKTSSRILLSALAGAAALLAAMSLRAAPDAAAPGMSPGAHPRAGFWFRRAARRLDLTADQRRQIQDIVRQHRPALAPAVDAARAARVTLRQVIQTAPLDEAGLAAATDRLQAAQRQVILASARMRSEIRKILTPAQVQQIDRWQERRDQRIGDARGTGADWLAQS